MSLDEFQFGLPAPDENLIYGACRPGHSARAPETDVADWTDFMQDRGIQRVCCLLSGRELDQYEDLLGTYRRAFGPEDICHAPIPDFEFIDRVPFQQIVLPFLEESVAQDAATIVHCSAGVGRTGHVLALWLAAGRRYGLQQAVDAVRNTGRNPLEAGDFEELAARLNGLYTD